MFMALPVFPALKNFTINGMPMLEEWCGIEEGDFPHLQNLNISNCSKLTTIPKLSHLKLLKKLEISLGPSFQSFSKERLPTSLQYLVIIDCPLLKEKCLNSDEEENWRQLGNIPNIWIDYQQMTKVSSTSNQAQDVEVADASHCSPAPVQAQVDIECQAGLLKQTMTKDYATGFPSKIEGETNMEGVHIYPMLETGEDAGSNVKVEGGSAWRSIPQGSRVNKITSDWRGNVLESTSSTSVIYYAVRRKHLRIVKSEDTPELSPTHASHGEVVDRATQGSISSGDDADADDEESDSKRRIKEDYLSHRLREPKHLISMELSGASDSYNSENTSTNTNNSGGGGGASSSSDASPTTPSRYESQKRRDWNTFGQYLKNHRPPLSLSRCSSAHVLEFLRYLDQFGKTKVHNQICPFYGQPNPPAPCPCPLRQALGSLDALIGRLRAAFEEHGGKPEANPFGARAVRLYLRELRKSQLKARGMISYEKKKRKRPQQQLALPAAPDDSSSY